MLLDRYLYNGGRIAEIANRGKFKLPFYQRLTQSVKASL